MSEVQQVDVPFDMRQTRAVRTAEASEYDYEITNLDNTARHYWFLVKFDLGTPDVTLEGTIPAGKSETVTVYCPHDDTATVAIEFTHQGARAQGMADLIAPLPTVGFEA